MPFSFTVPSFSGMSMRREEEEDNPVGGRPLALLLRALTQTRDHLLKLLEGTATYADIIAEGELKLEKLNIEKEFTTLTNFYHFLNIPMQDYAGLNGVRSMLELFQYAAYIHTIHSVCEQYGLKGCLDDPTLQELLALAKELNLEANRAMLTPLDAARKMQRVREVLGLSEKSDSRCLDLFAAVADSAAFYQFVRDKQFVGPKGHAIFRQQYQLITAQLQHEEYDETVLNHLYAAYKFIEPFMETKQNLHELMTQVTSLDATNGLKQLETVNTNITLIRLWFSRAEVSRWMRFNHFLL